MAPTYRSSNSGDGFATSFSVTKPTGTVDGDLIAIHVFAGNETASATGFDATAVGTNGDSLVCTLLTRIASSEGSSWTVTLSGETSYGYAAMAVEPGGGGDLTVVDSQFADGDSSAESVVYSTGEGNAISAAAGDSYYTTAFTYFSAKSYTADAAFTEAEDSGGVGLFYDDDIGAADTDIGHTYSGSIENTGIGMSVRETIVATIEQAAFRVYDDDDNPDDATALAAEDTAVTGRATETTTLVRVLLEATGNPAAVGFKLQVNRSGDAASLYEDVGT